MRLHTGCPDHVLPNFLMVSGWEHNYGQGKCDSKYIFGGIASGNLLNYLFIGASVPL